MSLSICLLITSNLIKLGNFESPQFEDFYDKTKLQNCDFQRRFGSFETMSECKMWKSDSMFLSRLPLHMTGYLLSMFLDSALNLCKMVESNSAFFQKQSNWHCTIAQVLALLFNSDSFSICVFCWNCPPVRSNKPTHPKTNTSQTCSLTSKFLGSRRCMATRNWT